MTKVGFFSLRYEGRRYRRRTDERSGRKVPKKKARGEMQQPRAQAGLAAAGTISHSGQFFVALSFFCGWPIGPDA